MPETTERVDEWKKRVGSAVRRARIASGKTQADLGKHAGVDWTTISKIERAETRPDFATIEAIADALEISIDSLVGRHIALSRDAVKKPASLSVDVTQPVQIETAQAPDLHELELRIERAVLEKVYQILSQQAPSLFPLSEPAENLAQKDKRVARQ